MKTPKTDRWRYHKQPGAPVHKDEVGYEALAVAIIKQAILDYQFADQVAKGQKRISEAAYNNRMAGVADKTKNEVVRFFKSKWYGTLCDIDPNRILRLLGVRA